MILPPVKLLFLLVSCLTSCPLLGQFIALKKTTLNDQLGHHSLSVLLWYYVKVTLVLLRLFYWLIYCFSIAPFFWCLVKLIGLYHLTVFSPLNTHVLLIAFPINTHLILETILQTPLPLKRPFPNKHPCHHRLYIY